MDNFIHKTLFFLGLTSKAPTRPPRVPERYRDGDKLLVFGKDYTLRIIPNSSRDQLTLVKDEAVLYLRAPNTSARRSAIIDRWYRAILQKRVAELMPKCEALTGLKCESWHIKKMRTRWGTCNTKAKRIWLSMLLAEKPLEGLEYIIIHELTHIAERKHSKRFYELVAKSMPNWKEVQDRLNNVTSVPSRKVAAKTRITISPERRQQLLDRASINKKSRR